MTTTTAPATAATVSAQLRRVGFNPLGAETPRTREGIRVKRAAAHGTVTVVVDVDNASLQATLARSVRQALEELGYLVAVNPYDTAIFTVARPTA